MKRIFILLCVVIFPVSIFAEEKETSVLIKTNVGKITVKLYNDTPLHRDNFLQMVDEQKYDSIMFHRVIKLFMIQAGEKYPPIDSTRFVQSRLNRSEPINPKSTGKFQKFIGKFRIKSEKKKNQIDINYWRDPDYKAPDHTIPAEIVFPKYFHKRGQLCAARTEDKVNPERVSSGFQFFIVTGKHYTDNELDKMERERNITLTPEQREAYMIEGGAPHLDGAYTIFGEVTKGLRIVQKIELTSTDPYDIPIKDMRIKTMKRLKR